MGKAKHRKKYVRNSKKGKERIKKLISMSINEDPLDLSYVTSNHGLLKAHREVIRTRKYIPFKYYNCEVPSGPGKGLRPKCFSGFKKYYKYIYERWIHLIKSCFEPNYPFYKFFGAKGIYMSSHFLNGKKFCYWCLANGLTHNLGTYTEYLQRRNKDKQFSPKNCYVVSEKEIHECKTLKMALQSLRLIKLYEEGHDKSVSYMTFYTRYYVYDMKAEDALSWKYIPKCVNANAGFSPYTFYKSVATEESCSYSVFISRIKYSHLSNETNIRPYEMLKPDFSTTAEANHQGKLTYHQQRRRDQKERKSKYNPYSVQTENPIQDTSIPNDVNIYNYNKDLDFYDE